MIFNKESDFEEALIKILSEKGCEKEVLKNYSEQDLLQNWANILFENNRINPNEIMEPIKAAMINV